MKNIFLKTHLILGLIITFLPFNGFAEQKVIELETISVIANRVVKPIKAIPNTVIIIDEKELNKQATINESISSILERTIPSFSPSSQKMAGRAETLRGKNPLYLIDGIRQHNALRDGQRDGYTIDPDFLERIEVINGANAIQGIGATGGVVSMKTKSAKTNKWLQELKVKLFSNKFSNSDGLGKKVTYISSIKKKEYDFVGGFSYKKEGIFYDAEGDKVGMYATQGDIMDTKSHNLFVKTGVNLEKGARVQLMINDFKIKKNGNYKPVKGDRKKGIYTTSEKGDPKEEVGDPAQNKVTNISLDYSNPNLLQGEVRSQIYYQNYAAKYEGGRFNGFFRMHKHPVSATNTAILDQSQINSKKHGFKITYLKKNINNFNILFGFDYDVNKSNQSLAKTGRKWVPDIVMTSYAPLVQLDYNALDNILISAGVRYEQTKLKVNDYTTIAAANSTFVEGGSPKFKKLLENIGVVYDFNDNISGYISYSEGFDMPDVGRVLRAINTKRQSVSDFLNLKPVITENKEIGIDFEEKNLKAHLSYYISDTSLGSRLEKDGDDIYHVKREKQKITGFDLTANVIINPKTSIGVIYSTVNGRYDSDKDGSLDTDLSGENIAPARLTLFLDKKLFNIDWRLQISHLYSKTFKGKAAKTNGSEKFEGYGLVDLFASKQTVYGDFSIGVENLLNKDYETYFSQTEAFQRDDRYFAGKGRTFSLVYSKSF